MFRNLPRGKCRLPHSNAVQLSILLAWAAIPGLATHVNAWPGAWSPAPAVPPVPFNHVHLVLLPGGGYHSRILVWGNSGGIAEMGWNEGTSGCGTFPYSLPVLGAWDFEADIHCGGHAQLPNGDLLSAGGEEALGLWGIPDTRTFLTGSDTSPGTWTEPPSRPLMRQARFYPSVTTLSDGRAIVTGGHRDEQAWFFGGRINGDPPGSGVGDSLFRHARSVGGGWDAPVKPLATAQGDRPSPREGHTAVNLVDLAGAVVFGGRDSAGTPINEQGSVWLLRREDGAHQPSAGQSPLGLCALRDQGRVVFPAGYVLDQVVSGLREGTQDLTLSLANHSRLGALGDSFLAGGGAVEMALGDALTFAYAPAGQALPGAATWYLLVRPGTATGSATPARRQISSALPARFALHPNQPNPFRRATSIAFDLPVASPVTLEVFDLLGRKVTTLAQGEHPAGAHAVEWDLRDARGGSVRPGVYVCRLVAGDFRAQMKMGVLP